MLHTHHYATVLLNDRSNLLIRHPMRVLFLGTAGTAEVLANPQECAGKTSLAEFIMARSGVRAHIRRDVFIAPPTFTGIVGSLASVMKGYEGRG